MPWISLAYDVNGIDIYRCDIVEQLQSFDVGLMPLPADEPWMRYKCNAKMIQYMAVGVPAVRVEDWF